MSAVVDCDFHSPFVADMSAIDDNIAQGQLTVVQHVSISTVLYNQVYYLPIPFVIMGFVLVKIDLDASVNTPRFSVMDYNATAVLRSRKRFPFCT